MNILIQSIGNGLLWDGIAITLAFLGWPLFARLLPPVLAWGTARLLVPALVAYLTIFPSLILGRTHFSCGTITGAALAVAVAAWFILGPKKKRFPFSESLDFEKVHLGFLAFACLYVPFIASMVPMAERMRDTSILNAIWTQQIFPVQEPWLVGYQIRYYTFGYYIPSVIGFFSGQDTLAAYNFLNAWTFAAYGSALYLLLRALRMDFAVAAFGAGAIALGSNAKALSFALQRLFAGAEYNWWEVSRVITNTINEFPLWTFTLGDLHPHYLALPLFVLLLVLTFGAVSWREKAGEAETRAYILASSFVVAFVWGANTWELPVCLAVCSAAVFARTSGMPARRRTLWLLATPILSALLALPFVRTAPQASKALGWVHARSSFFEMWLNFGLFFLPILGGIAVRLRKKLPSEWLWGTGLLCLLAAALQSALLFLLILGIALAIAVKKAEAKDSRAPLYLALLGLGLLILCELVHLEDIFGESFERLNTVFKFYMPAWALFGISAVLLGKEQLERLPKRGAVLLVALWAVLLSAHATVGLMARTGGFRAPENLEGLESWDRTAADDAKLMRWARGEVLAHRLSGTVMEATSGGYSPYARLMTASGLIGYLGWENYAGMWQTVGNIPELGRRSEKVKALFNAKDLGGDCARLRGALREEKIDYVVVGSLERKMYGADGISLAEHCLRPLHQEGQSVLLGVGEK